MWLLAKPDIELSKITEDSVWLSFLPWPRAHGVPDVPATDKGSKTASPRKATDVGFDCESRLNFGAPRAFGNAVGARSVIAARESVVSVFVACRRAT